MKTSRWYCSLCGENDIKSRKIHLKQKHNAGRNETYKIISGRILDTIFLEVFV